MNSQIKKNYSYFESKSVLDSMKLMQKILLDSSISQNLDFVITKERDNVINKSAQSYEPSYFSIFQNCCYFKLDNETQLYEHYIL